MVAGQPLRDERLLDAIEPAGVLETRKLMDGERYLVILDEAIGRDGGSRVLSVVPGENGAWFIDEVGRMSQPQIDAAGTPIVDQEISPARATEFSATPAADRFPHELTVSVADLACETGSVTCDVRDGTPSSLHEQRVFRWVHGRTTRSLPICRSPSPS